jgi:hypothetical protein
MQAFHPGTGMTLEFPDNTPAEEIDRHFMNAQSNMPTTAPSVAQQFIDGARGAYEQQQLSPAPVNGAGFVGLDPQQAQFMLQQRQNQAAMQQQSASDQARNRIEQQKMMQQGLEGEKDRSLRINLHKQTLKNQIDQRKIDADRMKHELEWKTKLDMLKEAGATEEELARLRKPISVSEGGALVDPTTGLETYKNPKTFAPDQPSGADWEKVGVYDEKTGVTTQYHQNKLTGERREIGPSEPIMRKRSGSSSGSNADIVEGSNEYSTAIHDRAKMIIENQVPVEGVPKISVAEAYEQAEKIVREENGLSPWGENDVARRNAVQSKQVEFYSVEEAKFTSKFGASPQTPAAQAYIQRQAQLQAEKWALEQEGFIAEIEGEKLYKRGK